MCWSRAPTIIATRSSARTSWNHTAGASTWRRCARATRRRTSCNASAPLEMQAEEEPQETQQATKREDGIVLWLLFVKPALAELCCDRLFGHPFCGFLCFLWPFLASCLGIA